MPDELFDAEASMEWVTKIDGRMGGIDWDDGCAYIAGVSCTRKQFELADRLVMIARNLAKEREVLRECVWEDPEGWADWDAEARVLVVEKAEEVKRAD